MQIDLVYVKENHNTVCPQKVMYILPNGLQSHIKKEIKPYH